MVQPFSPRWLLLTAFFSGALFVAAPFAMAADADYCITCKNPDQIYRCKVTGVGSRPSDALKLYCVIRTAKEGNHASCAAEKASSACHGVEKVYSYNGPALPDDVAADPRIRKLKERVEHDQNTFDKPDSGDAPKTLFELGGRAVNASRKGLRNAGTAIGVTSSEPEAGKLPLAGPTASLPATASTAQPEESVGTAQRMKQAAQGAGSAVGGFARKSYRCVWSLFRNCSEETENGALE